MVYVTKKLLKPGDRLYWFRQRTRTVELEGPFVLLGFVFKGAAVRAMDLGSDDKEKRLVKRGVTQGHVIPAEWIEQAWQPSQKPNKVRSVVVLDGVEKPLSE